MNSENKNLIELDAERFIKVRDHLNISISSEHGWRAIVAHLDGEYTLTPEEVYKISSSHSPGETLIKKLITRGMTIGEFISYASRVGDAFLLRIFNVRIAIQIVEHPLPEVRCVEGEVLTLSVRASSFPEPLYKWIKDGDWIPGASDRQLVIPDVQLTDAGDYRCAIFQRADISSVQEADISSVQFTDSSIVTVDEAPDVEIKKHPQSTPVNLGGDALLSCEVWGDKSVRYQWFRGQTALQDGPCIKGSKSNKLQLYNIDKNMLGCYLCQISSGRKVIETKGAALQISEYLQHSEHNYSATDKVALLIRCADYRCDQVLSAANKDVQTLANIFKSLNFKVVSFLNLTKREIWAAVCEFKKLVGLGVYCVFYFCGHGFEASGQVYLVPCDARQGYTTEDCILSDSICEVLEAQDPQLLCMILDVCRKPRHVLPALLDIRSPVRSGKTIIIHGTSYGLSAYENETHGILVSHLKNYLSKPISVETVFQRFRNALHKDPKLLKNNTKKQIPEVITNLYEPERSFADPIDYVGYTQEYTLRQQFWEESHRVPDPIIKTVNFPDFSVKMRLDFEYEFSNKLKIFTTVLDPGRAEKCSTWVEGIPNYVAEKSKNQVAKNEGCYHFRNYVELPNIHRVEFNVDLGRPLCSVLELWRDRTQLNQSRQPVEVEDGCESISEDELYRTSLYATNN
ncbi:mucosa-associated lymphoid tissue lymphoma translocation protein 1 [Plakobranchus ocellatus]|uniref:Mucosa-associated lymphoid tissue lymphoma translocation protein 1 n=1 Tax=Plakobranchus ocellatus TaxID=259542 RepID=A0AAV4AUC6_9GAST|nr:mucosa-associated lymphoid tissue lymphoma translocation protein 1 [Plakobranchus ocellatus]